MKRLRHIAAVAALTAGSLAVVASPAQATNYGCFDERVLATSYKVTCDLSAPTDVQARVYCYHSVSGATTTRIGTAVGPGAHQRGYFTAYAYCPSGYEAYNGGYTIIN